MGGRRLVMDARRKTRLLVLISLAVGAFFVGLGAVFAGLSGALLGAMMGTVILGVTTSLLVPATRGGDGDESNGCVAAWAVAALAVVLAGALLVGPNASAHTATVWSEITGHGLGTGIVRTVDGLRDDSALVVGGDNNDLKVFTPANGWQNIDTAGDQNWVGACIYDDDGDGLHMVVAFGERGATGVNERVVRIDESPAGTWTPTIITTTVPSNNRHWDCNSEDLTVGYQTGAAYLVNGTAGTRVNDGVTSGANGVIACNDLGRDVVAGAGGGADRYAPAVCVLASDNTGLWTKAANTTTEVSRGATSITNHRGVGCTREHVIASCWVSGDDFVARWDGAAIENIDLSTVDAAYTGGFTRIKGHDDDGLYASFGVSGSFVDLLHWTEVDGWHTFATAAQIGFPAADAILDIYVPDSGFPVIVANDNDAPEMKVLQAQGGAGELVASFPCPGFCADVWPDYETESRAYIRDENSTIYLTDEVLNNGGPETNQRDMCGETGNDNPNLIAGGLWYAADKTLVTVCSHPTRSADRLVGFDDSDALGVRSAVTCFTSRGDPFGVSATTFYCRADAFAAYNRNSVPVGESNGVAGDHFTLFNDETMRCKDDVQDDATNVASVSVDMFHGDSWFANSELLQVLLFDPAQPNRVAGGLQGQFQECRVDGFFGAINGIRAVGACNNQVLTGDGATLTLRRFSRSPIEITSITTAGFAHSDNAIRCSWDGRFFVVWGLSEVRVYHSGNLSLAVTVSSDNNVGGAMLSLANNYLYVANGNKTDAFALWQSTDSTAGDGGDNPNPVPTNTPFTANGTASPGADDPAVAGQPPGSGGFVGGPGSGGALIGLDVDQVAVDVGVSTDAIAWLFGIILTVGLMFGLFVTFKSPLAMLIGATLGIGISTALGLLPTWFIVVLGVFALAIVFFTQR